MRMLQRTLLVPAIACVISHPGYAYPPQDSSASSVKPSYVSTLYTGSPQLGVSQARYGEGNLVAVSTRPVSSGTANAFLYDNSGDQVSSLVFTQSDAATVQLLFGTAETPTHVVVTGRAVKNNGQATQFIAAQNINGTHPQILHTGHFLALQACQSADDSLWAVGREMPRVAGATYSILRHYTFTGKKLGTFIPNSSLRIKELPILGAPSTQMYLACVGNDVIFYDGLNEQLSAYSTITRTVTTSSIEPGITTELEATGFGVDSSEHIFASWQNAASESSQRGPLLTTLQMPSTAGTVRWQMLPMSTDAGEHHTFTRLLGVDGNDLVYLTEQSHGFRRFMEKSRMALTWSTH